VPFPPARHLLRARDFADAGYFEPLRVDDLARAAASRAVTSAASFRRAFGESPTAYLLTPRLERAAAMLRTTDRSVTEICASVGVRSIGSFTTSFRRAYGVPPTAYRKRFPPAATLALVPTCFLRAHGRLKHRTSREDSAVPPA
jgi:transcriptional regulator GlxA family with amidase domain